MHAIAAIVAFAVVLSLPAQQPATPVVPAAPAAATAHWSHDLANSLAAAKAADRPALVFFTASWCVPCKLLKEQVCSTAEFAAAFAGHELVLVDIDQDKPAAAQWQVGPIPDLRFVAADGEEIGGFVGQRDLAAVLAARDAALASRDQATALRAAVAKAPTDAKAQLALAEHLLQRPNHTPGKAALAAAIAADPDNAAGVAARAHWLSAGTCFHPIGRATDADYAATRVRLTALDAFSAPSAKVYADAVRAWCDWREAMRHFAEQRQREPKAQQQLTLPADAPLRATLARLRTIAALAEAPGRDAAADGVLIDGMLHYYSGDLAPARELLTAFVRDFPLHRWHGEGERFVGVVARLQK